MYYQVENDDLPVRDLFLISTGPNIGRVMIILRTRLGFTIAQAMEAVKQPEKFLATNSRMELDGLIDALSRAGAKVELR